jgi:hypothetical protein
LTRQTSIQIALNIKLSVLLVGTLLCSFAAGICGAFDAPLLVPLVFAVSAALYAVMDFFLWPQELRANNATIAELKNVDIWWKGLKEIQRRQPTQREQLVGRTEKQLEYEIASLTQLAVRYDKKQSSTAGQDDDAATEDKKPKKSKDSNPSA